MKRGWLLAIVGAGLGLAVAATATWQSQEEYSSSAEVYLGIDAVDAGQSGALYQVIAPSADLAAIVGAGAPAGVTTERVPDTTIVRITATGPDPASARDKVQDQVEGLDNKLDAQQPFGADVRLAVRVVQAPETDPSPSGRKWWRNLGIGGLAGLFVGLGLTGIAALRARRSVSA